MHRLITAVSFCILGFLMTPCSAALIVGDLAFIGFNADGDSDFAIVLLADVTNETVFFSDNEPGTSGEGTIQWETGTGTLAAGTVVVFTDIDSVGNAGFGASIGTLTYPDAGLNLSASGDGLYAFQGTDAATPSTYLAAIANDDFGLGTTGDLSLAGLTEGTNAIEYSTTNRDGGIYSGSRSSATSYSDYLALVNNPANWTTSSTDGESLLPFDSTSFTLSAAAVPEPGSFAILMACGGVVFTRRRR